MVLRQGEEIEQRSNGKNPNWKEVYNQHVKDNCEECSE
jgi:hypothetical protein